MYTPTPEERIAELEDYVYELRYHATDLRDTLLAVYKAFPEGGELPNPQHVDALAYGMMYANGAYDFRLDHFIE